MKRSIFNHDGLYVEYNLHRDGPPHQFVCCYRNKASLVFDKAEVVKQFKLGKGTPTREALTEWLQSLKTEELSSDLAAI